MVLFTLLLVAIGAFAHEDSEEQENFSEDAKPLRSRRPEYTAQGYKINYSKIHVKRENVSEKQ